MTTAVVTLKARPLYSKAVFFDGKINTSAKVAAWARELGAVQASGGGSWVKVVTDEGVLKLTRGKGLVWSKLHGFRVLTAEEINDEFSIVVRKVAKK